MNSKTAFINFVTFLFIFLFTYTAISKLFSFASFRYNLDHSPLIAPFSQWIAVFLPVLELAVALLLFFPKKRIAGLYASFSLMSIFSLYIAYALVSGLKLPCSCGGIIQSLTWPQHLWVNIILATLGAVSLHYKPKNPHQIKSLLQ